ncbi:hypothetical protein ACIA98_16565 [Streptomyces sp. NPDC051366]|uniref:hypothetical protein n=1 Tax=Streptomyces sp. NPDC051366 TaxID=3365652 RepID=UPI0037AEBD4E
MLRTASTLAMVSALAIGTALSAHAASYSVSYGANYATYDTSTQRFEVCDMERDGNEVYIYFGNGYGSNETGEYADYNGSQGGCGYGSVGLYKYMNICEDRVGWDECRSVTLKP